MNRLLAGYSRFRMKINSARARLVHARPGHPKKPLPGQLPEAVFITCSDARVLPELMLQCDPGQIFTIRNAGNLVPDSGDYANGVAASIEYAVHTLGIPDIIVCGHTGCGAMRELAEQSVPDGLPPGAVSPRHSTPLPESFSTGDGEVLPHANERRLEIITEQNVVRQLANLKQHPAVRDGIRSGSLRLHGWIYDIAVREIRSFQPQSGMFFPLMLDSEHTGQKAA